MKSVCAAKTWRNREKRAACRKPAVVLRAARSCRPADCFPAPARPDRIARSQQPALPARAPALRDRRQRCRAVRRVEAAACREHAISFARIRSARRCADRERTSRVAGKASAFAPAIFAQHEMADARLAGKFAGIFQPMIEPAQQDRRRYRAAPADRNPPRRSDRPTECAPTARRSDIDFRARSLPARLVEREKAIDAAPQKHVVPAGNVQRGNADVAERSG